MTDDLRPGEIDIQLSANRTGEKKNLRYVLHADWEPMQVFEQMDYMNSQKEDWGLIGFVNRDGTASILLPEDAWLARREVLWISNSDVSIFKKSPGIGYIQAHTKDVEVIEL